MEPQRRLLAGTPILTRVPGLNLHKTWGSTLDHIQDLSWYQRADAPMVLLDADTGERHPFWSELDTNPGTEDNERLLILRPAANLTEGHRYIVALRNLRDGAGKRHPCRQCVRRLPQRKHRLGQRPHR